MDFKTVKQRREAIGKKISWVERGWRTRNFGVVEDVSGKNVLVDGDWKWAPDMIDVRIEDDGL